MTNQEIHSAVEDIYQKISQLQENLKTIRASCKHEKKVEGMSFEMVTHICLICETCGESFQSPNWQLKNYNQFRGNRGNELINY